MKFVIKIRLRIFMTIFRLRITFCMGIMCYILLSLSNQQLYTQLKVRSPNRTTVERAGAKLKYGVLRLKIMYTPFSKMQSPVILSLNYIKRKIHIITIRYYI